MHSLKAYSSVRDLFEVCVVWQGTPSVKSSSPSVYLSVDYESLPSLFVLHDLNFIVCVYHTTFHDAC